MNELREQKNNEEEVEEMCGEAQRRVYIMG